MDRRRKREGVYEVAKNTQDRRDEEDIPHGEDDNECTTRLIWRELLLPRARGESTSPVSHC